MDSIFFCLHHKKKQYGVGVLESCDGKLLFALDYSINSTIDHAFRHTRRAGALRRARLLLVSSSYV
jgi:hypothetical protein